MVVELMTIQNQEKHDQAILFQYGAAIGRHDFHTALSKFLTEKYGDEVNWYVRCSLCILFRSSISL